MRLILSSLLLLPIVAFCLSLMIDKQKEKAISFLAFFTSVIQGLLSVSAIAIWWSEGSRRFDERFMTIYSSDSFEFGIQACFDRLTAFYGLTSAVVLMVISVFSRSYMHRENGYKRFFNHLLLFQTGLSILIYSGNFETFFFGWEIIGISSFLLIAFYRERYLPVRNGLKVLSFYRLGDVALLCGIWFFHHISHGSLAFSSMSTGLNDAAEVWKGAHSVPFVLSLLLILAAAIKSAQFPFSSWLPRAMEGPTVSSAVFYGALSVHLGIFLLMRSEPLWFDVPEARWLLFSVGLFSAILSNWTAAVQPTIKTQIAYSTVTQIGVMFICLSFGLNTLVLIHMTGHIFLRSYQLLISPSSMNYLIHHQFYHYDAGRNGFWNRLPARLRDTIYLMSVKEWGLDTMWYHGVWRPMKRIAKSFHFLRSPVWMAVLLVTLVLSSFYIFKRAQVDGFNDSLPYQFMGIVGLVMVLIAWSERRSAKRAWLFVVVGQLFFMASVFHRHDFENLEIALYLIGIASAFLLGWFSLNRLESIENGIGLNEFHGHVYEHPRLAVIFLISSLVMIGFPLSPTFLGFDILFSKIGLQHPVLVFTGFMTFVFLELSVLRIYARIFLGQHVKTYHEVAFRNS